jgi:mono/diheme cytochrome c family protein
MRGVLIALVALAGCDNGDATPDWSRMITQPKLRPYGASDQFADGRAMRSPPAGTVAREAVAAARMPAITRAGLVRGRERYAIACAPCHGVAGDGDTPVARAMQRRRPPSLHEPRLVALAPDALYRVVTEGYGVMPGYASLLSADDRWAVVAYVRTLELAWAVPLEALPAAVRAEVTRSLP